MKSSVPVYKWERYWQQIRLYSGIVSTDYGWLYLLPAATPFLFDAHRMRPVERRWLFGLLVLFMCESFFLVALLNPSNDKASRELHTIYFTPSYVILAVFDQLRPGAAWDGPCPSLRAQGRRLRTIRGRSSRRRSGRQGAGRHLERGERDFEKDLAMRGQPRLVSQVQ